MRQTCLAVAMAVATGVCLADEVRTLDARSIDGRIVSIDAKTVVVQGKDSKTSVDRGDVLAVRFDAPERPSVPPESVVYTNADDVLPAKGVSMAGETIQVKLPNGTVQLPVRHGKAILWPRSLALRRVLDRCEELGFAQKDEDLLVAEVRGGQWKSIRGVLRAIDADAVTFHYRDEDRKVPRASVPAVWLAKLAGEPLPAPSGTLYGPDGLAIQFASLTADAKTFKLKTLVLGEIELPRSAATRIRFRSDRQVSLGDLKPTNVEEHGLLGKTFAHRVNRCASGSALRLGDKTYDEGVGLHSHSALTYALGGKFLTFVALAGIDDSVRPAGNARLTISGDGKPLCDPIDLVGTADPKLVRVSVKDIKALTITVEFGADKVDVGDCVDLVEARLIK